MYVYARWSELFEGELTPELTHAVNARIDFWGVRLDEDGDFVGKESYPTHEEVHRLGEAGNAAMVATGVGTPNPLFDPPARPSLLQRIFGMRKRG